MAPAAIGFALNKSRSFPCLGAFFRFLDSLIHGQSVVAIHAHSRHGIARSPAHQIQNWRVFFKALSAGINVVFTDENQRQPPQSGQVHSFMHRTLGSSAVTEKTHSDPILSLVLLGKGLAHGNGRPSADNGGGAGCVHLGHGQVKGAAFALVAASAFAENFGHQGLGISTLGQQMIVASVVGDDDIFRIKSGTSSGTHGFLSGRQDHHAVNLAFDFAQPG